MSCMTLPVTKGRPTLTWTVMARQRSSLILLVNFKGKLIAMEVKVDPGSETNCIPLSHFRCLFPQLCSKDGSPKENALEPTLAQFEVYDGWYYDQPRMDHTAYSGHQRQQVSSSEVLRGDQGGSQNPDQSCYCNLAGTREGPMSKQGAQNQKASSICF